MVLQQLARKGGKLFGGWGTSYGGWIMALLGCFEPLLQRLVLVEPILNIDNAIWRAPSSVTVRAAPSARSASRRNTPPAACAWSVPRCSSR